MKKLLFTTLFIGASLFIATTSFAQTNTSDQELTMGIPEVLLINAVNSVGATGAVSLDLVAGAAGTAITGGTGTSYAVVSSIVATGEFRTVNASVTGVPAGTSLSLTTAVPTSGLGAGVFGTGTSGVALVNAAAAADIVTGIGSCYTGVAALDGYVLDWTWDAALGAYGSIVAVSGATATVVLTISAGS